MNPDLIPLQGILTAQRRLIELLLGARLANLEEPIVVVEKLRKILDREFRLGMDAPGTKSHVERSAIKTAALNHLHEILDTTRDRLPLVKKTAKV